MASLSTPYIDIHTHNRLGVPGALNSYRIPGTTPLANHVYAIGIHPWDAEKIPPSEDSHYQDALCRAMTSSCIAIGEIGLDHATAKSPEQKQRQLFWFEWQLQTALEHALPIIIHCVKAYNELISILKRVPHTISIVHGFIGSPELASRLLQSGCYLSFGPRTWDSPKTRQTLQTVPLDRLFFETDDSQQTIKDMYIGASEITGHSIPLLQQATSTNFQHIFGSDLITI